MASRLSVPERGVNALPFAPRVGETVSLHAVRKDFGARRVLRGIDLEINSGEFVAIVGRSGCGKSTLLRLVAGLDTATGGDIRVGNMPARGLPSAVRLMFQDARLLPWKRVAENVGLGMPNHPQARSVIDAALGQVGLADRARDWPGVLSGGQRQRVALARALAHAPQLLLLDEPLGALDALTRREMQELIAHLWENRRFTAILVTHDVEEAVALADRILVLDAGLPILDLRVDLPRPRPRDTAAFGAIKEQLLTAILGSEGA